ncbi:MAG: YhjD/YihY/BrkB family envelope integrity protein [Actinomycetes bacterium]
MDDDERRPAAPQGTQASHTGMFGRIERFVLGTSSAADRTQARQWWGGFPYAVFKKYSDDGGSRLAALLTYYGFLSLFPLALVFVAVLTMVLQGNEQLRNDLLEQLFGANYSDAIVNSYEQLPSGGLPLLIGLVGLLLSGMGGAFALYVALNQIWAVPWRRRFGFGPRYLRVLGMLVVLGLGAVTVAAAGVLAATVPVLSTVSRLLLVVASAVVATLVLIIATKVLTARTMRRNEYLLGCVLGGLVVSLVFAIGSPLLARLVSNASAVYGVFATVIGILTLFYLTAQSIIICMEVSAVRAWKLWPRGLDINLLFPADWRAYQLLAFIDERMPSQENSVRFDRSGNDDPDRDDDEKLRARGSDPLSPYDSFTTE